MIVPKTAKSISKENKFFSEEVFDKIVRNKDVCSDDIKKQIISGSIDIQLAIAQCMNGSDDYIAIFSSKNMNDCDFKDKCDKLFGNYLMITDRDDKIIQVIGKSPVSKKIFARLLKEGKTDADILKYFITTNKFTRIKGIKYNTIYEFLPDFDTKTDILSKPMFKALLCCRNNPIIGNKMSFTTSLNIDKLQNDENMVALQKKVEHLYFIEYDRFGYCLVFWYI